MTCALDFTTPKEGEGGGGRLDHEGGIYMLAVSPFVTKFSKSIFWDNKLPLNIHSQTKSKQFNWTMFEQ